nr:MAG TPA: hypothetical protein [Caudoviricetes sp.]
MRRGRTRRGKFSAPRFAFLPLGLQKNAIRLHENRAKHSKEIG